MSTVALRGTLIRSEDGTVWQWKGMWAFGSSLATAPAQSQQAFLYTFQHATHPSEIAIPGIVIVEEEEEEEEEVEEVESEQRVAQQKQDGGDDGAAQILVDGAPGEHDTATKNENTNEKEQPEPSGDEKAQVQVQAQTKEEAAAPPADEVAPQKDEEASKETQGDKPNPDTAAAPSTSTKEPPATTQTQPQFTFATVPEGHPAFTDACEKYPDKPCPVSGQWKGYFQNNLAASGGSTRRPTARADQRIQKVQETFYLFFNATPGPDVKYVFDDTPLSPTVHQESLVLVRGMGTNPFGTFELVGYLDLTSSVVEIQRQYVFLPPTPRTKRTSSPHSRKRQQQQQSSSSSTARHKKSYFTRKRQPSWKRKSLEEQEEETASAKRQRSSSIGGGKRAKVVGDTGPSADGLVNMVVLPPGTTVPAGVTGAGTEPGAVGMEAGVVPLSGLTNTNTTTSSSSAPMALSIQVPTGDTSALGMVPGAAGSATTLFSNTTTVFPGSMPLTSTIPLSAAPSRTGIAAPPGTAKRSKTPRKRSSTASTAGGSVKSTTLGGGSTNAGTGTSSSGSSGSLFLKLPPVGEPKKARWRAAHFLYYQRHDPEEGAAPPELSNAVAKTPAAVATAPSSAATTSTSAAASSSISSTQNPRYVVYEGEMVNAHREGRGICLYSNGMLYEGQWKRNKEHGRGQLWTADRRRLIYDGEWERGRMQGQGTYYYGNTLGSSSNNANKSNAPNLHPSGGSRYIGEFKENMRNGLGQYILPDGSVYDGMWNQGKMNGRGIFTWPDYSVYDGEWKDGERHGQGLLKTSDGFVYDGMWVHNSMEGRGIAQYPNGQTYEGLFANGRREGRGTMHFTNGAVYEGRFRDDAVDGQGTMKMSRALIVPNDNNDETTTMNGAGAGAGRDNKDDSSSAPPPPPPTETKKKPDFMIPISFQSDMTHIHAKAGFTAIGD